MLPVAAAIVEFVGRQANPTVGFSECRELLTGGPITGLEWSRGELAVWLRRLGDSFDVVGVAEPYRLLLDGEYRGGGRRFPPTFHAVRRRARPCRLR